MEDPLIKILSEQLAESIAESISAKLREEGITLDEFMDSYDLALGWIETKPDATHDAPDRLQ